MSVLTQFLLDTPKFFQLHSEWSWALYAMFLPFTTISKFLLFYLFYYLLTLKTLSADKRPPDVLSSIFRFQILCWSEGVEQQITGVNWAYVSVYSYFTCKKNNTVTLKSLSFCCCSGVSAPESFCSNPFIPNICFSSMFNVYLLEWCLLLGSSRLSRFKSCCL